MIGAVVLLAGCGEASVRVQEPVPTPPSGRELEWRQARLDIGDRAATAVALLPGQGRAALIVTRSPAGIRVHRLDGFSGRSVFRATWRTVHWPPRGNADAAELLTSDRGRLRLVRISRRGRPTTLWSRRVGGVQARWARWNDRRVIAWIDGRGRPWLAFGDGRDFGPPVPVRGLPAGEGLRAEDVALLPSGDALLAIGDLAGATLAVVDADGGVIEHQRHAGGPTRVALALSDRGRAAALVDRTGGETLTGDECAGAGARQVSAALLPAEGELAAPELVGRVRWRCTQGAVEVVGGAGDRFAALFSGRLALAPPGAGFAPPRQPWAGAAVQHVTVLDDGTVAALAHRGRRLVTAQLPLAAERVLGGTAPLSALAAAAGDTLAVAVWRDRAGRWNAGWGA